MSCEADEYRRHLASPYRSEVKVLVRKRVLRAFGRVCCERCQNTAGPFHVPRLAVIETLNTVENGSDTLTTLEEKQQLLAHHVRLVRRARLDYDDWRYVSREVRKLCDLKPAKKGRWLPRILTAQQFRRFYEEVDKADDVQHALMLRLLFYTTVRVSELCNVAVADVDLENCKIRVDQGKGGKDRYVLFGRSFVTALRTHIAAHPDNRWLFQTKRHGEADSEEVAKVSETLRVLTERPATTSA